MEDQSKDYPDAERPQKGTASNNYRPIKCLPMMRKILKAKIWEEIYNSLINCGLFPEEQKGYHEGTRGTGQLLYIYKHVLNENTT